MDKINIDDLAEAIMVSLIERIPVLNECPPDTLYEMIEEVLVDKLKPIKTGLMEVSQERIDILGKLK